MARRCISDIPPAVEEVYGDIPQGLQAWGVYPHKPPTTSRWYITCIHWLAMVYIIYYVEVILMSCICHWYTTCTSVQYHGICCNILWEWFWLNLYKHKIFDLWTFVSIASYGLGTRLLCPIIIVSTDCVYFSWYEGAKQRDEMEGTTSSSGMFCS